MHKIFYFVFALLFIGCSSLQTQELNFDQDRRREPSSGFSFIWPLRQIHITQPFRLSGRKHMGIDLAAPHGTQILAAHSGRVIYVGRGYSGYGKLIIVEKGTHWASFYSHCNKIFVRQGQMVNQGQVIGLVGRTGRATGPHLHFEVRRLKAPIDPLSVLPSWD